MIKFNRSTVPAELNANWTRYTKLFIRRRKYGQGSFYWNKYPNTAGNPISHIIIKQLLTDSDYHCAYCDKFPLWQSDKTIDHFKPKSSYPLGAYQWSNLFPACDNCQTSKLNLFYVEILKPDEITYDFNNYFMIDYTTFKIFANPRAIKFDRKRANKTIEVFNLNEPAHLTSRRHQFQRYSTTTVAVIDINDFAYRYMF